MFNYWPQTGNKFNNQTDYVGNKIYENGTLKRTLIDGGYIEGGAYHYYLTDHLGNNRAVFTGAGQLVQRTQYYPFGMAFADKQGEQLQPYKYNGKELDTRLQLNTYDYAARYMDPAIGRFTSIDPLAEKYYSWSPYAYVANNPLKYIDPDGKQIGDPYPTFYGNSSDIQAQVARQQYPLVQSTWKGAIAAQGRRIKRMAPGAITVSIAGKVGAFASVEGEVSVAIIFSGKDTGLQGYASGSFGVEKDIGISATLAIEAVNPDKPNKFEGIDLEGKSNQTTIEVPINKTISVSGSHTKMKSDKAGEINNYGVGISAGASVQKIFGGFLDKFNVSTQNKETKGFNTNNYNKEDDKQKEKR